MRQVSRMLQSQFVVSATGAVQDNPLGGICGPAGASAGAGT